MCLILIAYKQSGNFPLLIAANRDEYFARPTQTAHFWKDDPSLLAGRDLLHGGTWLGINKKGRFAAVTNFREPSAENTNATSRGFLVSQYLRTAIDTPDYLDDLLKNINQFDGFNLLLGDEDELYVLESVDKRISLLGKGVYGISNGRFDSPWPKVIQGKQKITEILHAANSNASESIDETSLFQCLADDRIPSDEALPDTGVGLEWERKLGSIFVKADAYGTRCSTLLSINAKNRVSFSERNFDKAGNDLGTESFNFII